MYTVKIYDEMGNEFENLRKDFESYYEARTEATLISKRRWCDYAIVEDKNFERLGWYVDGKNLDY